MTELQEIKNSNINVENKADQPFTAAYATWLSARGEVFKGYAINQDPSQDLIDRESGSFKEAINAPANLLIDIETKVRMYLMDDGGDHLEPSTIHFLNTLLLDLTRVRIQ